MLRRMPESAPPSPPAPAPEPAFFDNPAIDNLIAVTLELGAELWVQRERMRVIERLLADPQVAYLHAHNAGRGCFAARIDRN